MSALCWHTHIAEGTRKRRDADTETTSEDCAASSPKALQLLGARRENVGGHYSIILAEGAIALSVTLSGGALFAS